MTSHRERRLRVLLLVPSFPTAEDPYRSSMNLTAARLLSACADIRVVFLRAWRPGRKPFLRYQFEGFPVTRICLPQLPGVHACNVASFQRLGWPLVREELQKADLLHSVDLVGAGLAGSYWAGRAGVRHLVQVVGSDVNSLYPLLRLRRLEAFWQQHVDVVLCNSNSLAARVRLLFPAVPRVRVVYRGTNLELFHPPCTMPGGQNGQQKIRFLFLGGFPYDPSLASPYNLKGGMTVLDAWRAAEDALRGRAASLVIAGPASGSSMVVRWQRTLRHPSAVRLAGLLAPRDVPAAMGAADVVLLPSLREGLPNVAMEAAACGRPVLGSSIAGVAEVVQDGTTGLLVPPGDPHALGAAMVRLSACGPMLRVMGAHARALAERKFDNRAYASSVLSLYEEAMQ